MPSKAPERLLDVQALCWLTGFGRQKVQRMCMDPAVWAVKGGTKLIAGEYRLPESFYNRWVDAQDVAPPSNPREPVHV